MLKGLRSFKSLALLASAPALIGLASSLAPVAHAYGSWRGLQPPAVFQQAPPQLAPIPGPASHAPAPASVPPEAVSVPSTASPQTTTPVSVNSPEMGNGTYRTCKKDGLWFTTVTPCPGGWTTSPATTGQ